MTWPFPRKRNPDACPVVMSIGEASKTYQRTGRVLRVAHSKEGHQTTTKYHLAIEFSSSDGHDKEVVILHSFSGFFMALPLVQVGDIVEVAYTQNQGGKVELQQLAIQWQASL